jgi:hypothetical protein
MLDYPIATQSTLQTCAMRLIGTNRPWQVLLEINPIVAYRTSSLALSPSLIAVAPWVGSELFCK